MRIHYKNKLRLQNLKWRIHQLQRSIARSKGDANKLLVLKRSFHQLITKYKDLLGHFSLRKSLAAVALMLGIGGLSQGQAQNVQFIERPSSEIGLDTVQGYVFPTFIDVDADGDIDLLGLNYSYNGYEYVLEFGQMINEGTPVEANFDSWELTSVIQNDSSELELNQLRAFDIDSDGDMDIVAFGYDDLADNHFFGWFENIGDNGPVEFAELELSPFGLDVSNNTDFSFFDLGDIDGDGDLDLLFHQALFDEEEFKVSIFENEGTPQEALFDLNTPLLEIEDPAGSADFDASSFMDVDSDGDLDVIQTNVEADFGSYALQISLTWFENVGTESSPAFSNEMPLPGTSPITISEGFSFSPVTGDIDADGDSDILLAVSEYSGDYGTTRFILFQNESTVNSESILAADFQLSPNPAIDFVEITGLDQIQEIKVFDMQGVLLDTQHNSSRVAISALSAGRYTLQVLDDQGRVGVKSLTILPR